MNLTLDDNELDEYLDKLEHLDIAKDNYYVTTILLIYNDDLTVD